MKACAEEVAIKTKVWPVENVAARRGVICLAKRGVALSSTK